MRTTLALIFGLFIAAAAHAQPVEAPLVNPSFEGAVAENGLPEGWSLYAGAGSTLSVVEGGVDGGKALLINDANAGAEIGITQDFPLEGGQNALVRVSVKRGTDAPTAGAYLQFRFFPSNTFRQTALSAESTEEFNEIKLFVQVPEGTTRGRIYLYCHAEPTPKVMVDNVSVQSGVEAPRFPEGPAPEPTPPQYDALKDLHLQT
ncbi:MAG: hypothetical protein GF393_00290, partial [Armatimonadia bacterium]|nr:hypothetical protein [Armatimonadia bacterium]